MKGALFDKFKAAIAASRMNIKRQDYDSQPFRRNNTSYYENTEKTARKFSLGNNRLGMILLTSAAVFTLLSVLSIHPIEGASVNTLGKYRANRGKSIFSYNLVVF